MSTDMSGITQLNLFSKQPQLSINVTEGSRYRILEKVLPWEQLADVANTHRMKHINIHLGRNLNLRGHIGAYVAQSMNGWTDRMTEEMVRYHAGVRVLCGMEESSNSIDRTRIEGFRTSLGKEGAEELNQIIVQAAVGAGFSGTELCASDTTVQESPIAYPTEVGHLKNISEKLWGIGKSLKKSVSEKMSKLQKKVQETFTNIRLFTKGKGEELLEKKRALSLSMHGLVNDMKQLAQKNLGTLKKSAKEKALKKIQLFDLMLPQIKQWLKTGTHPKEKILSLWETAARAIQKGKIGKATEYGRRWIVTRLLGGYVIGAPCIKLGADSDTKIMDEVMMNFLDALGVPPELTIYDRGGDSQWNEDLLENLGVQEIGIFKKGQKKMAVSPSARETARVQRSLTEASIANIKHPKYNFTKPRARSTETCLLKGHTAMLGFNLNNLLKDVSNLWEMKLEIT